MTLQCYIAYYVRPQNLIRAPTTVGIVISSGKNVMRWSRNALTVYTRHSRDSPSEYSKDSIKQTTICQSDIAQRELYFQNTLDLQFSKWNRQTS